MKHIRYFVYLYVLIGYSVSFAGSYEDFFAGIKQDNSYLISRLLARGFDPNTPNPDGQHGLVLALQESSFKVAKVLAEHPAIRTDSLTQQGESALMLAALRGNLEICERLIGRDAEVNKTGWTPLHYAATGGHAQIIALLLKNGARIDAESPNGSTPLMMAAMYGSTEAVKALLDAGADPQLKNSLGFTALDFANKGSRPDAIKLLSKPAGRLN